MRRVGAVVAVFLLSGCSVIPGTSAYKIKHAQDEATKVLIDPSSAQLRSVRVGKDAVCGEVNGKNRMGAYVGFVRWVATQDDKGKWTPLLDPQFDAGDLAQAEDFCSSVSSNSFSSPSLIQSACGRASEQRLNKIVQQSFDLLWKGQCEATR